MTPGTRAARDRLARYAAPDAPPMPPFTPGPEITHLTVNEVKRLVAQITEGIRETLTPDLRLLLAALDEHETVPAAPILPLIGMQGSGEAAAIIDFPASMEPDATARFRAAWAGGPVEYTQAGKKLGPLEPAASQPCMRYRDGNYVGFVEVLTR